MCGLVAAISKTRNGLSYRTLDVFETLLRIDSLRGEDSTGVFVVNNHGNVGIGKAVGDGFSYLKDNDWKELRSHAFNNGWAIVGHNRKATRGSITEENAHPFWVDNKVVLVHNGSHSGSHKHLADVEVDSHAIAHVLAEAGPDGIEGALKRVDAAYALIWYDVHNKRINVIRNEERPLAWVETHDAFLLASEPDMLRFAMSRHNIQPMPEKTTYMFRVHELNTFQLGEHGAMTITSKQLDCQYRYKSSFNNSGHHLLCGWEPNNHGETLDGAMTVKQEKETPPVKASNLVLVETNKKPAKTTVAFGVLNASVPIQPWMRKVTLKDFTSLYKPEYNNAAVKVLVNDWIDFESKDASVIVTGKTCDANALPVAFKLGGGDLEYLTRPENIDKAEEVIVEITITTSHWIRQDSREHKDIDNAEGIMLLCGKEPKLLFTGNVGHA